MEKTKKTPSIYNLTFFTFRPCCCFIHYQHGIFSIENKFAVRVGGAQSVGEAAFIHPHVGIWSDETFILFYIFIYCRTSTLIAFTYNSPFIDGDLDRKKEHQHITCMDILTLWFPSPTPLSCESMSLMVPSEAMTGASLHRYCFIPIRSMCQLDKHFSKSWTSQQVCVCLDVSSTRVVSFSICIFKVVYCSLEAIMTNVKT